MANPLASAGDQALRTLQRLGRRLWDDAPPAGMPHGLFRRARLTDFLPWRQWDATHELFLQEHSAGFVLELMPLIGGDETTGRILSELFTEAAPPGAFCQVISYASPKIGPIVDRWAQMRAGGGEIYAALGRERRDHFVRAAFGSASTSAPFYFRDFRVFLAVELKGAFDPVRAAELGEVREKFVSALRTIRVPAERVDPARLIALAEEILNPGRSVAPAPQAYNPDQYIGEQVMRWDTAWRVHPDRIVVDTVSPSDTLGADDYERVLQARRDTFEIRGFGVREFPGAWTQGQMARTLGDMFNDQLRHVGSSILSLCFSPWAPSKTKTTTEFMRMRSDQMAANPLTKAFPATRKKAEDWAHVAEDVADGALLAEMGFFALSIAPAADAERADRALRSVFRAARFTLEPNACIHTQTVLACLPLTLAGGLFEEMRSWGRLRRMPTTAISRLAPMQGEYVGVDVPHLMLVGRRGQPFFWSPFGNTEGNHNTAVIGSSGSGKSVFMQEIATALRSAGCEVFVIDDGRSFQSSCQIQEGAWLRFSMDLDVCLNPFSMADFDLAAAEPEYEAEVKRSIAVQVESMCRAETRATPEERGVIDQAVNMVWRRRGPTGSIDHVCDVMLGRWALHDPAAASVEDADAVADTAVEVELLDFGQRGRDLALSLAAYTSSGTYGRFFNGLANIEITNPYTVFEMSDLETKPELRSVIVLGLMFLVRQRMKKGGRALRKALIIDEAWQLLGDGATGEFIEGFARRCRKEGGALITGTQSLNDYYDTGSGARACIENSDWKICLRLIPEALDQLRNNTRLSVDEASMTILKSLKTSDGEYSEVFVMGPGERFVGRLVLDRYSATLYSTRPQVSQAVHSYIAEGVPVAEAVRAVAYGQPPRRAPSDLYREAAE